MSVNPDRQASTILIVDDVTANLRVMADSLEAHGFQVLVAQNGEEALQRVGFVTPDLILLDVMMPGIDGFEVCRRLKLSPLTQQIPVIFMTALTDTSSMVLGFEVGAVDYITKPFKMAEVLARVNTHLAAQAMRRQLMSQNAALTELNDKLSWAHVQLLQSERLASIGQLAAGIAHEINNPLGFVRSNLCALGGYFDSLFKLVMAHEEAELLLRSPEQAVRLQSLREQAELGFLKVDIPALLGETMDGIVRVQQIVQNLRDFSPADSVQSWQWADLHKCIDSTLSVIGTEISKTADIVKDYADTPEIECLPSQLNQVIFHLMMNAAQAIGPGHGQITIRTGVEGQQVWIEIADSGAGIPEAYLSRIFDPFFTTRPVGQGTGLGLSLVYGAVQAHKGRIDVCSKLGVGTTFRVVLPVQRAA